MALETAAKHHADADIDPAHTLRVELLEPNGVFPNNPRLPVLLYRRTLRLPLSADPARVLERRFSGHAWSGGWRDGVYNYHHYHSTAHEVLGCYAGRALVQVGGPEGPVLEFARGDVLVLPAGAAHKSIENSGDFSVVGAYAQARDYDMLRGHAHEDREAATQRIADVPLPAADPVFGAEGPLMKHWGITEPAPATKH
ncbi:MAG: hypothetical protein RL701_3655 [Pseudomonadota bacterium]